MALHIVGDKISLAADGTGTLTLEIDVEFNATHLAVYSTGRCEVQAIERLGVPPWLAGFCELDQLKREGNQIPLPATERLGEGERISFKLLDISGTANTIYIALVGQT